MKYHHYVIATTGCKVNQYESQQIRTLLDRLGIKPVPADGLAQADLCVINTCAVTQTAGRKSRQAIGKLAGAHQQADIIVVGCYAAVDRKRLSNMPRVRAVISHDEDIIARLARLVAGNSGVHEVCNGGHDRTSIAADICGPGYLNYTYTKPQKGDSVKDKFVGAASEGSAEAIIAGIDRFDGRCRAFVKIQDGCDAGCTYCIIPKLRSRLFSRPVDDLVAEVRDLVAGGHKEVVLCGIFLGAYGRNTAKRNRLSSEQSKNHPLAELVSRLVKIAGLRRLRLSSLEPGDLTEDLLGVLASNGVCVPHLHLPLQSGSDRILRRMGRQYTIGQYIDVIDKVKAAFDRPAITTDIIVGFPGESDDDFGQTLEVARAVGFAKIHAFRFSPRPGTAAGGWSDRPDGKVLAGRIEAMGRLEKRLAREFRRQFTGQNETVLVEGPAGAVDQELAGQWAGDQQIPESEQNRQGPDQPVSCRRPRMLQGRSGRYFMVEFVSLEDLRNQLVTVEITNADEHVVKGRLVETVS